MENFTIIKRDMLYNSNLYELLDKKVSDYKEFLLDYYTNTINESLIDCESPIEQILSLFLNDLRYGFNDWNPFIDMSWIKNNQEITCKNGKKYRLDFYFVVTYKNQGFKFFDIECDGYEFHQKTKEQVENDYQRQRDLQNEGFEVIRFSGSEIYDDPQKCVDEIQNIILSKCQYIQEKK